MTGAGAATSDGFRRGGTVTSLLEFDAVTFAYPDGHRALDQCSLTIEQGRRVALIGVNGAGKSTLFRIANGLLRPQGGYVRYAGSALDYGRAGLRRLRSDIGIVFQNPDQQLFSASVREDVSFGPVNLGLDPLLVRQRVEHSLHAVGMSAFADRPVHNLSFGQKKRVCMAGVLAMEPRLIILDEPMAGLDQPMRNELLGVLDDLHRTGVTLLLSTHDIDFAYQWADRIHLIERGRCSGSFETEHLADNPLFASAMRSARLPLPTAFELHRHLARLGLSDNTRPLRSVREICGQLAVLTRLPQR